MTFHRGNAVRHLAAAVGVAFLLSATPASAQSDNQATAEALFQSGKQLLDAGKFPEACPKLSESLRLDPATGTLLALAYCQEMAGQTASAWASYRDAASRARRENNPEREQAAKARAIALERELSTLSIEVSPELSALPGLSVRRDGTTLFEGAWNTPVPIDPGPHTVQVTATGREPWTTSITIQPRAATQTVKVPALVPAAVLAPSPPSGSASAPPPSDRPAPAPPPAPDDSRRGLRTIGFVAGGVGVVGLGLGTALGLRALAKNDDSAKDCAGNVCGPQGATARRSATSAADLSTSSFIVGGALLLAGTTLVVLSWPQSAGSRASAAIGPSSVTFAKTF